MQQFHQFLYWTYVLYIYLLHALEFVRGWNMKWIYIIVFFRNNDLKDIRIKKVICQRHFGLIAELIFHMWGSILHSHWMRTNAKTKTLIFVAIQYVQPKFSKNQFESNIALTQCKLLYHSYIFSPIGIGFWHGHISPSGQLALAKCTGSESRLLCTQRGDAQFNLYP